jgi:hypothetical protein
MLKIKAGIAQISRDNLQRDKIMVWSRCLKLYKILIKPKNRMRRSFMISTPHQILLQ